MSIPMILLGGSALVLVGLLVFLFSLRSAFGDPVSRRLNEYLDEQPGQGAEAVSAFAVRRSELAGSFTARTLLPAFRSAGRFLGRLGPAKTIEDLQRQMAIAGNPLGLGPREFYGLRLIILALGAFLAYRLIERGPTMMNLAGGVLAFYVCTLFPRSWLRSRVRSRQNKIRKGLPDALDMLSVCAEAGLGFDQSLQRVSQNWKSALSQEFGRVVSEMELGVPRRSALRNLADRLDVRELSSFVTVILQSDQLGMSIAETLHVQAKQMREERRFSAQEQARKIPLKMLFPMVLFIMPAMFAIILGPMVPAFLDFFQSVNK